MNDTSDAGAILFLCPLTEADRLARGTIAETGLVALFNQQAFLYQSEGGDREPVTQSDYKRAERFLVEAEALSPMASRQSAALALSFARHIARGVSLCDINTDTEQGLPLC